jgi:segregation and condensation protein A
VPDMIKLVSYELERMRPSQSLSATRLFERQRSRRAMICLFLAILELVKLQAVDLTQGELFGDIGIRRRENFKQALENAEKLDTVEQDYQ